MRGLPLTERETKLFRVELIAPKLAVGMKKPETVVLYQLTVNCCPFVNEENQCKIYPARPLMCQSFPVVAGALSNRCQIYSYRIPGASYDEPFSMAAQLQANEKLEKYIQNRLTKSNRKGLKIWEYNLATMKWLEQKIC